MVIAILFAVIMLLGGVGLGIFGGYIVVTQLMLPAFALEGFACVLGVGVSIFLLFLDAAMTLAVLGSGIGFIEDELLERRN